MPLPVGPGGGVVRGGHGGGGRQEEGRLPGRAHGAGLPHRQRRGLPLRRPPPDGRVRLHGPRRGQGQGLQGHLPEEAARAGSQGHTRVLPLRLVHRRQRLRIQVGPCFFVPSLFCGCSFS